MEDEDEEVVEGEIVEEEIVENADPNEGPKPAEDKLLVEKALGEMRDDSSDLTSDSDLDVPLSGAIKKIIRKYPARLEPDRGTLKVGLGKVGSHSNEDYLIQEIGDCAEVHVS